MRWLYAAYRLGALTGAPEGMAPPAFKEWVVVELESLGQGEGYILTVPFEGEDRPIGFVLSKSDDHRMEPHAFWFPWATDRNKVEGAVKFFSTMRFTNVVLIVVTQDNWRFFDHLLRYGMMKVVGKIDDYFGSGKPAKFYQTRGFVGTV